MASNWNNGVPRPADEAVINLSGSPTVTISTNGETVNSIMTTDPLVISGGGLTVAANSTISGGLSMTGGSLTANGPEVTLTVTGTTTVTGASLSAEGGATLSMPNLTSYQGSGFVALEATGAQSELDLPNLTSVSDTSYSDAIQALDGGTVKLSSLASMTANEDLEAQGNGSVLNIPELTSFSVGSGFIAGGASLLAEAGAVIDSDNLTTLKGVTLTLSDTASISLGQISNIDGSSVFAESGASVSLPKVTSYGAPGFTTLEASRDRKCTRPSERDQCHRHFLQRDTVEALNGGTGEP